MEKTNFSNTFKFSQRSENELYKFNNPKNKNPNNNASKQKNIINNSRKNSTSNINLLSPMNKYQQNFKNFIDEHNLNSQSNNYFLKKYNQVIKNQKNRPNKSANSSNLISNIPIMRKNKKLKLNKSPLFFSTNNSLNYKNINQKDKKENILNIKENHNTKRITEYYSSLRNVNRNKKGNNKSFVYLSDDTNLSIKNATTANTSNNIKNIVNELKLESNNNLSNNEILIEIEYLIENKKGNNKLLKLKELNTSYLNYPELKTEKNENLKSLIESYSMNSYKGLYKEINEDNIISLINIQKPENFLDNYWPKSLSYFAIFDGHCGKTCSEYLKNNLHHLILNNEFFPSNPIKALEYSFDKVEEEFYLSYDKSESGSCALVCLIIDDICYIANCGNSRLMICNNNGKKYRILTNDHNLKNEKEKKRIENNGSQIYQEKIPLNKYIQNDNKNNNNIFLLGPYRIKPGGLSITRSIGDFSSKILSYGGLPNSIISQPEIITYKINSDCNFIIICSHGIFNVMKNSEIINLICDIKDNKNDYYKAPDLIIKNALKRNCTDNLSCIVVFIKNNNFINSSKEKDSIDMFAMYNETDPNEDKLGNYNFFGDLNEYCKKKNFSKFISSPKTTKNKLNKSIKMFENIFHIKRNFQILKNSKAKKK